MVRALSLQTAQKAEETRDFLPEDRTTLEPGTTVLMKRKRAPGESKLFQNWKGQLKVVKRVDVYTYLLASDLYPRRQFIVHRSKIRPITTPQTVRENTPCAWKVRRLDKTPRNDYLRHPSPSWRQKVQDERGCVRDSELTTSKNTCFLWGKDG